MALIGSRRNGKFVGEILFDKRSENGATELRDMLSLVSFRPRSEEGRQEREDRSGNGEWMADCVLVVPKEKHDKGISM